MNLPNTDFVQSGASSQSRCFVKHFWHVSPAVGLILQLHYCVAQLASGTSKIKLHVYKTSRLNGRSRVYDCLQCGVAFLPCHARDPWNGSSSSIVTLGRSHMRWAYPCLPLRSKSTFSSPLAALPPCSGRPPSFLAQVSLHASIRFHRPFKKPTFLCKMRGERAALRFRQSLSFCLQGGPAGFNSWNLSILYVVW